MIIHDAENVEQTFKNGKCLSCIRQAKLVEKKIQQVQEYLQKGNSFNTFNTLVIDAPPDAGTILPMTPLVENEALELFFEKAELDISKVPTLKETAEVVVKQCASLPLAIVTIASSLKEEEDICEWRNALSELTNKVRSIKVRDDEVFVRLKFSFNGLKDEKIQRCFLYCALYPEDHNIPKTELVDYWIA
ncbi:hypothetical protein JRO89_XS09G0079300 [Xanthoceras sorbifolium]|uniref:NB-ARC domain-containing protein n=1 Tax=Xanthoceras sorbifolium TaxID=99658 RepID=A0ABQ8HKZ7_9ROSI|nr:hypothetical protein JRO89_XS09G0079300 [Xanthoceras sorbifolium]